MEYSNVKCVKEAAQLFISLFARLFVCLIQEREQKQKLLDSDPVHTSQWFSEHPIKQESEVCFVAVYD